MVQALEKKNKAHTIQGKQMGLVGNNSSFDMGLKKIDRIVLGSGQNMSQSGIQINICKVFEDYRAPLL